MIKLYTDGCCIVNPGGAGGAAAIAIRDGKKLHEVGMGFKATTNNRMEIIAALIGLETLDPTQEEITVISDSKYLVNGALRWIRGWKKNGWINRHKEPVKNRDLWEALDHEIQSRLRIDFKWIKGHNGDHWNEECDQLAEMVAMEDTLQTDRGFNQ